eukprot:4628819-Pleurochrysis_carterae.AAC.2
MVILLIERMLAECEGALELEVARSVERRAHSVEGRTRVRCGCRSTVRGSYLRRRRRTATKTPAAVHAHARTTPSPTMIGHAAGTSATCPSLFKLVASLAVGCCGETGGSAPREVRVGGKVAAVGIEGLTLQGRQGGLCGNTCCVVGGTLSEIEVGLGGCVGGLRTGEFVDGKSG